MACTAKAELLETMGQDPIVLTCDYIDPAHMGDHFDALFKLYWRRPLMNVPAMPTVLEPMVA